MCFADCPPEPLQAALWHAAEGRPVFPCNPRTKAPLIHEGFKGAVLDPIIIRQWWTKWPDAMIGCPMGAESKIFIVDIDRKGGDPDEVLEQLRRDYDIPQTLLARTAGGGYHVYFEYAPDIQRSIRALHPAVDTLGAGGYAILPPSRTVDGRRYEYIYDADPVAPPSALLDRIYLSQRERPTLTSMPTGVKTLPYYAEDLQLWLKLDEPGGWHEAQRTLVARWVQRGIDPTTITAMAPAFRRPPYTIEQTIREIGISARGAQEKFGKPEAPETPTSDFHATPFDPMLGAQLGPREWVYGHIAIKKFVSVIGAPGGTGKTSYATAVALSVATGKALIGEQVHEQGAVWLYNLEDPKDEVYRRLQAAIQAHQIDPQYLRGWLYVDSGRDQPLILAQTTKEGIVVATPIVDALVEEMKSRDVKMLIVDPFVKSHRLEENKNEHIDQAATLWSQVADRANAAIVLVHHFRKGGVSGQADAFRGASALIDAARAAVSLAPMSEAEASAFNLDDAKALRLVRLDNAKLNLAPRPEDTTWIELCSIQIPSGDKVQAVRRWHPPGAFEGFTAQHANAILDRIANGFDDHTLWGSARQAKDRWAGNCIIAYLASVGVSKSPEQASEMIHKWIENGVLEETTFLKKNRTEAQGLRVNDARRPGAEWGTDVND
jgi:hypothetical protein